MTSASKFIILLSVASFKCDNNQLQLCNKISCSVFKTLSFFRPIFRSYKPLDDENFGESVLPDAEPAEVRDKIRDELDKEHEALAVENLVMKIVIIYVYYILFQ